MKLKNKLSWLLFPFALLYGIVVYLRNRLFDLKVLSASRFDGPVISVGNITVGGTGKTPHIEYLVRLFKDEYNLAILSRGYKRKTKGFVLADKNSKVQDIGDEPRQMKQKFPDIQIAVDGNRVRGVTNLFDRNNIDVVLMDDAYQHRYVEPGLSILLVDYNRPMDQDHLLPWGELRESASEIRRAHIVVVTKTPADIRPIDQRVIVTNLKLFPFQSLFFTTLAYGDLVHVFSPNMSLSNSSIKDSNYAIVLVTGIAQTDSIMEYLRKLTTDIVHIKFSDHHNYTRKDLVNIAKKYQEIPSSRKVILTTEKDAMRLLDMKHRNEIVEQNTYYLPLRVEFINNNKEEFEHQVTKFVKKDKTHQRLSKQKHNFNTGRI